MCWCFGTPSIRDIHSTQAADGESSTYSQRLDSLAQKYQELDHELAQVSLALQLYVYNGLSQGEEVPQLQVGKVCPGFRPAASFSFPGSSQRSGV